MPGSIVFESDEAPARISYSVPLPGSHRGKRLVRLDLGLEPGDWQDWTISKEASVQPGEALGIRPAGTGFEIDATTASRGLRTKLKAAGYRTTDIDVALGRLPQIVDRGGVDVEDIPPLTGDGTWGGPARPDRPVDRIFSFLDEFVTNAAKGVVTAPLPDTGGTGGTTNSETEVEPDPQLFLVERYALSSSLGDYGLGRTVRTFTLLPGETTTIRLKTWQTTTESRKQASSIVDSHEEEAKDRFQTDVQRETTDKATHSAESKWAFEAEAEATWGWGKTSAKASAQGSQQAGREQFAKNVSTAVAEHSNKASARRELTVTSESETTSESGLETTIERTITNVNRRRVLNFVFRELNQTYITRLHLTGVDVAFTNGTAESYRQVPLSGLRDLLAETLRDDADLRAQVAATILGASTRVIDYADEVRETLDRVTYDHNDGSSKVVNRIPVDGKGLPLPPEENVYYRFKRGPIGNDLVDGVLLSEQDVVMRTDSVLVEALLGEADALDSFAMEVQTATAAQQTLANRREELLQRTLSEVPDPVQRAELAAQLFGTPKAEQN